MIIDEASQCAIPHVVPLLFRARRALIIGDVMQLPHIATLDAEREAKVRQEVGLRPDWLERHRLGFRRHSAFHAAERASGGSLLLDEHFRCHPEIADLANQQFYEGHLNVLTDVGDRPSLPERRAIVWSEVAGHAARPSSGASWVNQDELEKVVASVRYLLNRLPADATVGVVTPFKAQSDAVQRQLGEVHERVRVGTVHAFQGGERDVMIFSLVAGEGMRPGSIRWVDRQLNLWNVAITRARSHLILVGDSNLWRRQGGVGATLLAAADGVEEGGMNGARCPDDLSRRFYGSPFAQRPNVTVELGRTVNGHPVDAVLREGDDTTAVLLDPGPDEGDDAARHLRLMLRRRTLVANGRTQYTAQRLPAWKLYDAVPASH